MKNNSLSEHYLISPDHMKLIRPRRVGIEYLALHAISQLELDKELKTLLLKTQGIHDSWQTLRKKMENQQRVTATFNCEGGDTLHLRKATQAEPEQVEIYNALGLDMSPGGIQKTVVSKAKTKCVVPRKILGHVKLLISK